MTCLSVCTATGDWPQTHRAVGNTDRIRSPAGGGTRIFASICLQERRLNGKD